MNRAYSILTVKAVEDDQRVITGIATTPAVDRMGDIVEPLGVKFTNPLALLHQHNSDEPVGTVRFDKPTKDGVTFTARLPLIADPGPLKDRVDTAWGEVKNGLVRAVSIGFRPLEYSLMENGGVRYTEIEVFELSLVSIPAQAEAVINTIKSIDAPLLAATGKEQRPSDRPVPPGVTGKSIIKPVRAKEATTMKKTIAEQISAFQETRKAKAVRMDEIMDESGEKGETLNAEQKEEYDTLAAELKELDEHIGRLQMRQKSDAETLRPAAGAGSDEGTRARTVPAAVKATPKLEPGIRFARIAKCFGLATINKTDVMRIADALYKDADPVVHSIVQKAAVSAGSTTSGNWAANLVGEETSVFADFAEFLRPTTILGKFGVGGIPALRRVPFRTPLLGQTGGGAGYWVGEGKAKPLTSFDFSRTTLDPLKVASIAVVTMEVVRDSSPAADVIIRDALAAALRERQDVDFIDPAKAASAGVSPASITNGVAAIHSAGNTADDVRADLRSLFSAFIADNNAPTNGVFLMPSTIGLSLSLMTNALGQAEFPDVGMNGGTLNKIPVITSEYVPSVSGGSYVALVNASDIYIADDGDVAVDVSMEASLEMSDAPAGNATTPTAAQMVSLWQTNSVGFRGERTINWAKRRDSAVALLDQVNWGAAA